MPHSRVQARPDFAARALQQLAGVSRFGMVAAMLPRAEKAIVKEVLAGMEAAGHSQQVLQALGKQYKV